MNLTADDKSELLEAVNYYHFPEYLDLISGEKDIVFSGILPQSTETPIRDFFAGIDEYTFTTTPGKIGDREYKTLTVAETGDETVITPDFIEDTPKVELGEILGYPECCSKFVAKLPVERDYITSKINAVTTQPFYTNDIQESYGLISHYPCAYDCEKSVSIGKRRYELLQNYDEALAEEYRTALSGCVIYIEGNGAISSTEYHQEGDMIRDVSFEPITEPTQPALQQAINQAGEFELLNHNAIRVNGQRLNPDGLRVIFFE